MLKITETVALDKKKQSKFAKKVSKLKTKVQKGEIIVKENEPAKSRKKPAKQERGVIYIGHIPHGFYEEEMMSFFKQFGVVTNVRVCRSYKTGRSKGYGFVEFMYPEVAEVAADTMHNYLMFKRRLDAKYIPPEKQRTNYFLGAPWSENKTPYQKNVREAARLKNKNHTETKHLKKAKAQLKKVKGTIQKLASLGIEHRFQAVDIPGKLEGTEKLIEKTPIKKKPKKAVQKETPILKTKLRTRLIQKEKVETPKVKKAVKKVAKKLVEAKPKVLKTIKKQKEKVAKKKNALKSKLASDKLRKATLSILNNSDLVSKKSKLVRKK